MRARRARLMVAGSPGAVGKGHPSRGSAARGLGEGSVYVRPGRTPGGLSCSSCLGAAPTLPS